MLGRNKKLRKISMRRILNRNNDAQEVSLNSKIDTKRPILRVSSRSEDVEYLQKILNDLADIYPSLPILTIDGFFGNTTRGAVEEFQKIAGISPSGIVDDDTWNRLYFFHSQKESIRSRNCTRNRAEEDSLDLSNNVVKEGSSGRYVKDLQRYLNMLSNKYSAIERLEVDGKFGPKTQKNVLEFQKIAGVEVDGIVGEETWNALYNDVMGKK